MSRDQRVCDNHALAMAQRQAIQSGVPLAVVFCLLPRAGQRAQEHYRFMLAGLREVESELAALNIPFMTLVGAAQEQLEAVLTRLKPQQIYFDFSPLRGPQRLHRQIAGLADCPVVEVDAHNIVPVWVASDHQEIGARTLRPKLRRLLPEYLGEAGPIVRHPHGWPEAVQRLQDLQPDIEAIVRKVPANGTDISRFTPGTKAAEAALRSFVADRLAGYAGIRNDPAQDGQSGLSPYLHYGQLSPAAAVRAVMEAVGNRPSMQADADAFIEEVAVRRELGDNFCFYNSNYDNLHGAPDWAQRTLDKHRSDTREFSYSRQEFESAATHDEAWNAAQKQLVHSGKMHGYMRMYWAKKVLEWSASPEEALATLLYLNDFYHIDGGDPNGYAGVLWSIAGLHDRPWGERPVYGVVRSMVYNGLKRKFDIAAYIRAQG